MLKKLGCFALVSVMASTALVGCNRDAQVASHNLSQAADNFEIPRRTVFYNGITGEYMLSVEGLCSVKKDNQDNQLELTCKTGPSEYKKHILGLSDNVTYFSEQVLPVRASAYHYKVVFKPQSILPDIDLKTSATGM